MKELKQPLVSVIPNKGLKKNNIKGCTISEGHKFLYLPNHPNSKPNGYYAEHRFIMEQFLGRLLKTEEKIHHKDNNGLNNDIKNLVLTNSSEHSKIHYSSERMVNGRRKKYRNGWNPALKGKNNPNWRGGKVLKKCENPKCEITWLTWKSLYNHKRFCSKICQQN